MLMADDGSEFWTRGDFSPDDEFVGGGGGDGDEELSIDIDTLFHILREDPQPPQRSPEDSSQKDVSQGESAPNGVIQDNSQCQTGHQLLEGSPSLGPELTDPVTIFSLYNSDASDSGTGGSAGSFNSAGNSVMAFDFGNMEPPTHTGSPVHACSASLKEWVPGVPGHESSFTGRAGVSPIEIPTFSTASSFANRDLHNVSDRGDNVYLDFLKSETEVQCRHVGEDVDFKYPSHSPFIDDINVNFANYGALGENSMATFGPPQENNPCTYMEIPFMDADLSPQNVNSTESTICQSSDVLSDFTDHYSAMQYGVPTDGTIDFSRHHLPSSYSSQFSIGNQEMMTNMKDEIAEFSNDSACSSSKVILNAQGAGRSVSEVSMPNPSYFICEGNNYLSSISGNSSSDAENCSIDDKSSTKLLLCTPSHMYSREQATCVKDEVTDEFIGPGSHSVEVIDEAVSRKSFYSADAKFFVDEDVKQSSGISHLQSTQKHILVKHEKEDGIISSKRARHSQDIANQIVGRFPIGGGQLNSSALEQYLPCAQPSTLSKMQLDCIKDESEDKLIQSKTMGSHLSEVTPDLSCNFFPGKSHVEEDSDICIIEDMSHPPPTNHSPAIGNSLITSQQSTFSDSVHYTGVGGTSQQSTFSDSVHYTGVGGTSLQSTFSDSVHYTGVGGTRIKSRDERYVLRVALQDLSQPKSEASPPDGDLAVSLLRHQRIALSWMVQKETASFHCSGGILADDQGLGKTVSTIALILKERPPSFRASQNVKQGELETLNLDEDDDVPPEFNGMKQDADSPQVTSNRIRIKSMRPLVQVKGRPSAGTLIVCPTSVLRQWAEELNSKVTSKAKLSVLVYHGSNRTKDAYELASYDVVLTTYSIVSMEVPKQSLGDEDDEEKGKPEDDTFSSKKRKYPNSDKKCSKNKKGLDCALLESAARPLAKVAWFRVVLDEAQSIKNHRTQVARACWGLRAKRRWCLSGTPIQNAIDDLYSYFRFLRYDPYALYTSFCSTIKVPINRNPSKGYKKLQAVLKTIMLRRTKDTLLDGEPIINLPPKSVELKKVEFSDEERNFYSRLEADSRAQFQEYADAGTVKQNYVNILLMLLRLRQACDHPLLVRPYNSSSLWRSSVEMAKKLPRDKQIWLLNCLEASLAICGICNDPPEDAVVSICGHVFCNQCISEHLTGEDKQCPVTNCKVRLCASSVFSKATLNSSLSDEPCLDGSPNCSVPEVVDAAEIFYGGNSYSSTKIKAALEVLQSLCKPQGHTTRDGSAQNTLDENSICPSNSNGELLEDNADRRHLAVERSSNNSAKVVGEKAIVFSQWTRMLDLLEACLKNSSIQYRRLDGTMSVLARDKAVKDFNTLPEVSVMIMSLKAASLGLNMVAACHVLLLDLWWNPTTEDQAIDRAHRIGQTRPVTVLRLTVRDTVEDRILALQQKKREMVASAFGEDGTGGRQTRLTVEDLKYLFMM